MRLFLLLVAISLVCLSVQFEPLASFTYWQHKLIYQGQWWRILTGNFTHTNLIHLAMNILGLWIITYLYKPKPSSLLCVLLLVSISVGILNLTTAMSSYVGLSGTLHGIFAYYALNESLRGRKSSWLLVIGVLFKVGWEMTMGAAQSTSELINAAVAVESHLFGVLTGLSFALASNNKQLLATLKHPK
ncbi:rhombosortase [Vibrio pectenicida]|uniref:Rhombosortase n=1 Tax=Vibrio pectenicida TaxID=62763 RepID=A0A3R9EGM4_9VIBR|nr:rhombosortase [Vibrio pectenicida]RSD29995.1 rhombosortase [Vibrio pectenicida]